MPCLLKTRRKRGERKGEKRRGGAYLHGAGCGSGPAEVVGYSRVHWWVLGARSAFHSECRKDGAAWQGSSGQDKHHRPEKIPRAGLPMRRRTTKKSAASDVLRTRSDDIQSHNEKERDLGCFCAQGVTTYDHGAGKLGVSEAPEGG